jgi:nucleotide-binding universal stress UspA family protein
VLPGEGTGAGIASVLAEAGANAELVVVGSYGAGSGGGMRVGTTAHALLERSRRPVAVVRGAGWGEPPRELGPVVAGYDGSPTSVAALELAARLADLAKAPLLVCHTWSEFATDPVEGSYRAKESWDALAREAAERVERAVAGVHERHPDLEVGRRVVGDTPLRALIDAAAGARFVVVGRRRTRAASHRRLGSTSGGLVEFAPCPVIVVPPVDEIPTTDPRSTS